jgi:hypothetical protein
MNYRTIAANIVRYFTEQKGKGHSRAVVHDAQSTRSIVVVANEEDAQSRVLRGVTRGHLVTLEQVERGDLGEPPLVGYPLILDNGAVVELLTGLDMKIKGLEEPPAKPKKKAEEPKEPQ